MTKLKRTMNGTDLNMESTQGVRSVMNSIRNRWFLATSLIASAIFGCSENTPTKKRAPHVEQHNIEQQKNSEPAPEGDRQHRIVANQDGIVVNGMKQSFPLNADKLATAFGKPSRQFDGANTIHTWDDSGIFSYTKPGAQRIHALSFAFGKEDLHFWPKTSCKHIVAIGPHVITKSWGKQELKTAGFKPDPDFPFAWTSAVSGIDLLATLDEETDSKVIQLDLMFKASK